jgi:hypothetical protein
MLAVILARNEAEISSVILADILARCDHEIGSLIQPVWFLDCSLERVPASQRQRLAAVNPPVQAVLRAVDKSAENLVLLRGGEFQECLFGLPVAQHGRL